VVKGGGGGYLTIRVIKSKNGVKCGERGGRLPSTGGGMDPRKKGGRGGKKKENRTIRWGGGWGGGVRKSKEG